MFPRKPSRLVREEINNAQTLLEGSDVVIPKTNVYPYKESYVIRQKFIQEDNSVQDIRQSLEHTNSQELVLEYDHVASNFISKDGVVYWVDPTKGVFGRIIVRLSIPFVSLERWRRVRKFISKPITELEHVFGFYPDKYPRKF